MMSYRTISVTNRHRKTTDYSAGEFPILLKPNIVQVILQPWREFLSTMKLTFGYMDILRYKLVEFGVMIVQNPLLRRPTKRHYLVFSGSKNGPYFFKSYAGLNASNIGNVIGACSKTFSCLTWHITITSWYTALIAAKSVRRVIIRSRWSGHLPK